MNMDNVLRRIWRAGAGMLLVATLTGCTTAGQTPPGGDSPGGMREADEKTQATGEAVEEAFIELGRSRQETAREWRDRTFAEFEATVYREPDGGKYIVSGDLPIVDRKHLEEFFENEVQKAPRRVTGELIIHSPGGVDAAWDNAAKATLTYCVSNSFGSRHATVVAAMASATGAWEAAADINFIHEPSQDGFCTAANGQVVFDVRPVTGAAYLARAFFPDDIRVNRNVIINDSSFRLNPNGNLSLRGILRHELGHTLGFRHEHTRPEAGTCFEDTDWSPLTSYDAFSVMHYPQCNGAGDWSLNLTHFDQNGAACQYGPAAGFSIDTNVCAAPVIPTPPAGCGPQQVTESGSVNLRQEKSHGPYAVAPGTQFTAAMNGTGDPDLYVRFDQSPTRSQYNCRPYLSGPIENCDLTVPTGASQAFVMVRGYRQGTYQINIEHTPNP